MEFKVASFVPEKNLDTLRRTGLHKIAGAMMGIDELTIKEAVGIIGARAYQRRAEMKKIAAGLVALAEVTGEKTAANPMWEALLHRGLMPAVAGGAIATLPSLMSSQPTDTQDLLTNFGMGAALGGVGGMANALHQIPGNSQLNSQVAQAVAKPIPQVR